MLKDVQNIISEVKKVIEGKDEVIEKVMMTILAGGHVLLEDVPGVGKTSMAIAFSKASGLDYRRVQFTQDTMASDITGFTMYSKEKDKFEYKKGAAFCNLLLADEINRTSPKTQAALLEVMEEGKVTVDGKTHELPSPFICIATQNPFGSAGTQPLPESQLDRFMIRLSMGYPSIESQINMVKARQNTNPIEDVKPVITAEKLIKLRGIAANTHIDDDVVRYAIDLCEETKKIAELEHGVSPRALLAVVALSKAKAFMNERDFVIPEDVASVFTDACSHRVVLKPQAKMKNLTGTEILDNAIKTVKQPKIS